MEHGAWGRAHGAWSMGQRAWSIGQRAGCRILTFRILDCGFWIEEK